MRLGKNGFAKRLRRLVVRDCYAGARLLVCEQFRVIVAIESMEEAATTPARRFVFHRCARRFLSVTCRRFDGLAVLRVSVEPAN